MKKTSMSIVWTPLLASALLLGPDNHVWKGCVLVAMFLNCGLLTRSLFATDKEQIRKKEHELLLKRTRELEEELGIEPLSFSDLPFDVAHDLKKEV